MQRMDRKGQIWAKTCARRSGAQVPCGRNESAPAPCGWGRGRQCQRGSGYLGKSPRATWGRGERQRRGMIMREKV